jgi:cell division protein FtsI/penicillin-binding protein 2
MRHVDRRLDLRLSVIIAAALLWIICIALALLKLQVKEHDWLAAHADREQMSRTRITATRGIIYDRAGREVARSVPVKTLCAAPAEVTDAASLADKLAAILDVDRETIYQRLVSNQPMVELDRSKMVTLKRKLTDEEVASVGALKERGLHLVDEMKRYYVNGATGAQVLGFVDIDEKGRGGIELSYDKVIRGSEGKLLQSRDAFKKAYDDDDETQASKPGSNVSITIDTQLQSKVEEILKAGVIANRAHGGTIVVIRPATGEILAMAGYPSFDPNNVSDSNDQQRHNRAIELAFEPGSVFKLVTYSAALSEGLINPDSQIDIGAGEIEVAGHVVHDESRGVLTAAKALAKSSNVAAIKIGQRLGTKRLGDYVERFGFGKRTGIELPWESHGLMTDPSEWDQSSLGSIPMGYGIGVTALQAVTAFGAIANGGEWVKPYLVSKVSSSDGTVIDQHQDERHRVVSPDIAAELKTMLEGVVISGTGKQAKVSGYSAAGKTGTAHKIDTKTGRYAANRYVASFAGFAPVENPQIACIVSIDEPGGAYYAADVAAPIFAKVASYALPMLGVEPEDEPGSKLVAADVRLYQVPEVEDEPARETVAVRQTSGPVAISRVGEESQSSAPQPSALGLATVPDLMGKGLREAAELCAARGLRLRVQGEGVVIGQYPAAGANAEPGLVCQISLARNSNRREKSGPSLE